LLYFTVSLCGMQFFTDAYKQVQKMF
jgi:hypothetical protein